MGINIRFLAVVLGVTLAGCGSKSGGEAKSTPTAAPVGSPAAAPVEASAPAPANPKPLAITSVPQDERSPAKGTETSPAKAVATPAALPPLPQGELLADLGKDFRPQNNQPADSSGGGTWSYLGSPSASPWEDARRVRPMEWVESGGAPHFQSSVPTSDGRVSDVSLMADPAGKGVILLPSYVTFHYALARWTSSIGGEVVIQGNFHWNKPTDGRQLESLVFVDGILAHQAMLARGDMESRNFRIEAHILPGSTVDFLVGEGIRRNAQARDSNATTLTAAIVKTGDGKQEIDPETVEKISATWKKSPKRDIPKDADISKSVELPENRLAWFRKLYVDTFVRDYKKDEESKAAIVSFLEAFCVRRADVDGSLFHADVVALGQKAMPRGNWDPLASAVLGLFLVEKGGSAATREGLERLMAAEREFPQRKYPPEVTAAFKMFLAKVSQEQQGLFDPIQAQHEAREYIRSSVDDIVQAASQPNLTKLDREMLMLLIGQTFAFGGTDAMKTCRFQVVGKLSQTPGVDPWIREMCLAQEQLRLAWVARGNGFADSVTQQGWKQFHDQLTRARFHALAAWKLHPELPEAPSVMISITMAAGGLVGENERFWFDEALAADLNYRTAYSNLAWALRPRWGGSHDQMLALARECLATGRFETTIPERYHDIVFDIASELGSFEAVMKMPGVFEDYKKLLAGGLAAAQTPELRSRYTSRLAAVHYLAGDKAECARLLDELGPQVKGWAFEAYGVYLNTITRELRDAKRKPATYFAEDQGQHTHVAFAPATGKLLAAEATGKISVWDVTTRKQDRVLSEHSAPLVSLEAAAERKLVLSASNDGKVVIWKAESLEPARKLELKRRVHAAALRPDGLFAVIACGEETTEEIVIWDLKEDKQSSESLAVPGSVNGLAFASDGKTVYFSIPTGDIARFEKQLFSWTKEDSVRSRQPDLCPVAVTSWKLASGNDFFAGGLTKSGEETLTAMGEIASASGTVKRHIYGLPSRVTGILPLADGHHVAAVCSLGSVVIWDENTGLLEGAVRTNAAGLHSLTAPADETCLAAVDAKGYILLWPLTNKKLGFQISTPLLDTSLSKGIRTLAFLDDDKLFVESAYGGISLWDWKTGCHSAEHYYLDLNTGLYNPQQSKPFRDGRRVAVTTLINGQIGIIIHDYRAGKTEQTVNWQGGRPTFIAVAPSGKILAVGDEQGVVTLIDPEKGAPYSWGKLKEHRASISTLEFTPDGSSLASGSRDGQVKVWDLPSKPDSATKSPISRLTFSLGSDPAFSMSVNADASLISNSIGALSVTNVYNGETGQLAYSVQGGFTAFSSDGKRLLTGFIPDRPSAAKLWDATNGRELFAGLYGGHIRPITAVAVSPDGKVGLTGDLDGYVRAWNLETGQEIIELPLK
jgi:WD40 repeat protein